MAEGHSSSLRIFSSKSRCLVYVVAHCTTREVVSVKLKKKGKLVKRSRN